MLAVRRLERVGRKVWDTVQGAALGSVLGGGAVP